MYEDMKTEITRSKEETVQGLASLSEIADGSGGPDILKLKVVRFESSFNTLLLLFPFPIQQKKYRKIYFSRGPHLIRGKCP